MNEHTTDRDHAEALQSRAQRVAGEVFDGIAKEVTQAGTANADQVMPLLQERMMSRMRAYDLSVRAGTPLSRPKFLEKDPC